MINIMKKFATIACCICFALGGYFISTANNVTLPYTKTAQAAQPQPTVVMQYPVDLLKGHTNNVGLIEVHDTIHDTVPLKTICDTVTVVKYKTRWRVRKIREFAPDTICSKPRNDLDTIYISKPTLVVPKDSAIVSL